jgi:hypothetical protein
MVSTSGSSGMADYRQSGQDVGIIGHRQFKRYQSLSVIR